MNESMDYKDDVVDLEPVEDVDETVEDSTVPEIPKSEGKKIEVTVKEPGKFKKAGRWLKRKFDKARRNPVVVGIASFAAGVGVTLGYEALSNHFSKDEEVREAVDTEFVDDVPDEVTEDFVPNEVDETVEEPEIVTTEV